MKGDELDAFIREVLRDPEGRAAFEDAQQKHAVIDKLLARRLQQSLTQTDVAKRMGVKQPTVSQFETEDSDPRLSTLQRYARAVGARVEIRVVEA